MIIFHTALDILKFVGLGYGVPMDQCSLKDALWNVIGFRSEIGADKFFLDRRWREKILATI